MDFSFRACAFGAQTFCEALRPEARTAGRNCSRAAPGLAWALSLLLMLRWLGQGLLMGVAGAALVLLLQELADPTLLFWSIPWENLQLIVSDRRRVNHFWLHRTQDLARKSIGLSIKSDGFPMGGGFVLTGVGWNKQLVH